VLPVRLLQTLTCAPLGCVGLLASGLSASPAAAASPVFYEASDADPQVIATDDATKDQPSLIGFGMVLTFGDEIPENAGEYREATRAWLRARFRGSLAGWHGDHLTFPVPRSRTRRRGPAPSRRAWCSGAGGGRPTTAR
jgi:hypothetical protein